MCINFRLGDCHVERVERTLIFRVLLYLLRLHVSIGSDRESDAVFTQTAHDHLKRIDLSGKIICIREIVFRDVNVSTSSA